MDSGPLVSVVINNYNYGHFLRAAIDSALGQTYQNLEVVVVDDGSTDDSRAVLAACAALPNVRTVLSENRGQASAFNLGVEESLGEVVCFLDADDVFLPHKVERVVQVFAEHQEAGWLRHNMQLTDENLDPLGVHLPHFQRSSLVRCHPETCLEHPVRYVVTSSLAMRREVATAVLPVPDEHLRTLRFCADAYLGMRAAQIAACYTLAETLALYRRQAHQRLRAPDQLRALLDRTVRLDALLSEIRSAETGHTRYSSSVYKHRLVLCFEQSARRLSVERAILLLKGVRSAASLFPHDWKLYLRQTIALAFAFVMPKRWLRQAYFKLGGEPHGHADRKDR